jgi:hypothetical protein
LPVDVAPVIRALPKASDDRLRQGDEGVTTIGIEEVKG